MKFVLKRVSLTTLIFCMWLQPFRSRKCKREDLRCILTIRSGRAQTAPKLLLLYFKGYIWINDLLGPHFVIICPSFDLVLIYKVLIN